MIILTIINNLIHEEGIDLVIIININNNDDHNLVSQQHLHKLIINKWTHEAIIIHQHEQRMKLKIFDQI